MTRPARVRFLLGEYSPRLFFPLRRTSNVLNDSLPPFPSSPHRSCRFSYHPLHRKISSQFFLSESFGQDPLRLSLFLPTQSRFFRDRFKGNILSLRVAKLFSPFPFFPLLGIRPLKKSIGIFPGIQIAPPHPAGSMTTFLLPSSPLSHQLWRPCHYVSVVPFFYGMNFARYFILASFFEKHFPFPPPFPPYFRKFRSAYET